jgi:hypothetical protein
MELDRMFSLFFGCENNGESGTEYVYVAVYGSSLQCIFPGFDEDLLAYLKFFDANTFFFGGFPG